jgi:hypothetical protein
MKQLLLALALSLAALQSFAQPAAVIDGVQMPAWLERGNQRVPLVPGMELRAGDRITTGNDSRVMLKLAEGSMVTLGPNGRLVLQEIQPTRELFRAALNVLEGAFRFTTDIVQKARKREVSVRVGQVITGIRGTDFWGRSRADRQIVCLIEGAIEVGADGEQAVTMDKPLQFYRREEGKTQPVGVVEVTQLAEWAKETDIEDGKGAVRLGGKFSVQLAAAADQAGAFAVYDQLRAAGYPAEMNPRKEGDKIVYYVRIRQLPSRAEAQALANRLKGQFGVQEPRVSP